VLPHPCSHALAVVDREDCETEPVRLVSDCKLQRGVNVALLLVAANVHGVLSRTTVGETVNEPGVQVKVEHYWLVVGEDGFVFSVCETMRMVPIGYDCASLTKGCQKVNRQFTLEKINDINESDLHLRQVMTEHCSSSK